ncbi:MAG TPA: hypothetical protein VLG12_01745 [Candidatus Saccharimonadales bacterium]|nr:hypothetical protein [Candidatus Saccharimonadales bacterium]
MKPQDIIFFIIFLFLLYKQKPTWATIAGLLCLCVSIPLFAKWIFFTAERLTWYSAGFFLLAIILSLIHTGKQK